MKERNPAIDVAKGIAIISVVLGHVVTSYHNSNMMMDDAIPNYLCKLVYSFHMPLFFMISGYLVSTKEFDWTKCWSSVRKNLISYGIPYVAFCVCLFVFKWVFSSSVNSAVSFTDLLLIPIYPIGMMWFLYALLFVSVLHILLTCIFADKAKRMLFELSISLMVLIIAAYVGESDLGIYDSAKYWFWYSVGVYIMPSIISRIKEFKDDSKIQFLNLLMAVLYCGLVYIIPEMNYILGVIIKIVFSLFGAIIIFVLSEHLRSNKLLLDIGILSLPIFLFHGYIISVVRIVLSHVNIPLLNGITPLIVCSALGVGISILIYKYLIMPFAAIDFLVYPHKYIGKK